MPLIDADEGDNRLLVWVKDSSDLAAARDILQALGVPPGALWLEVGEIVQQPGVQALPNGRIPPTGRNGR